MFIRLGLRNLTRQARRTTAILITLACGSLGMMGFDGFNHGIMHQYQDNTIHAHYGYGQIYQRGYRDMVFENPWEHWIDKPQELIDFLQARPEITHVFPRVSFSALLTNGATTLAGMGQGVEGEKEASFFYALNIEEGVALSDQMGEIALGLGLARGLNVKVGDSVTLMGQTIYGSLNALDFRVAGIFHTGSKAFDDMAFQIPLEQAKELLGTQSIESVALGLRALEDWDSLSQAVESRLPALEAIPFAQLDKVYYQHSVDWLQSQFRFIECILLLIVILGLLNTSTSAIFERKGEIGNLRANGDSTLDVVKLLAYESLFMGLIGSLLGLTLAWIGVHTLGAHGLQMPPAPGLTRSFHIMIELQPAMAIQTVVMSVICSLFANIVASWHIARMPISQALRSP